MSNKNKTPKSRRQQQVPMNTDPNFQLHGQSPPVNFSHGGIRYFSPPNPYSVPFYTQQAYRPQQASPPEQQSSPIPSFNLDDDNLEPLWASQPFQHYAEGPSQHYSEGPSQQFSQGPSQQEIDDSPVEEVPPVKAKRKYTRRAKPVKNTDKDVPEPWNQKEEIALCKAWVAKSEDNIDGNAKKAVGFWTEVTEYFHAEMGEAKRTYDSLNCKWKNRIRPKVSQFSEIYNNVKSRNQSGACETTVYQEAEQEYRAIYNHPFALTECWKILKDHPKWKRVEMPKFFKSRKSSSKKSKTSENTSQGNSDSVHVGVNLNDEAGDSEEVAVQEPPRPMGRDRAKKKAAASSSSVARSEGSLAGDHNLVDALVSKFTMAAAPFFSQRKESSSEYLQFKNRELEVQERRRQEEAEIERMKIAQRDKELDLQQKMFEFQQQQKFDEDMRIYNEDHEHLTGRALAHKLFIKKKIKERWNLDF